MHGKVEDTPTFCKPSRLPSANKDHCIDFLAYTDKYGVVGAAALVQQGLLTAPEFLVPEEESLASSDIETAFKAVTVGHRIRKIIARASLPLLPGWWADFREQELQVDGYAAEVLQQIRRNVASWGLNEE